MASEAARPPGNGYFAGIDEVGRGCLAGPVVAAAVVLSPYTRLLGLRDSKKIGPKERRELAREIRSEAVTWAIGRADVHEIDRINILRATILAMRRAMEGLSLAVGYALIDGKYRPDPAEVSTTAGFELDAVVRGDDRVPAIAAASIIAKVARDDEMADLDRRYPRYGFAEHKGYGTASHLAVLEALGPCDLHRRSFSPVKKWYDH